MDGYYIDKRQYKNIDVIYESNKEITADILYEMALDTNLEDAWDNHNVMYVMYYLLRTHKKNNDVKYLKSKFRGMLKIIFDDEAYVDCRTFLGGLWREGFIVDEGLELFEKYLKTEIDPRNIEVYKYQVLAIELYDAFSEQEGFVGITGALEMNEPRDDTVEEIQKAVNYRVKKYGGEIVDKYLKIYINHRYAKERSKVVLRQMKINDDVL